MSAGFPSSHLFGAPHVEAGAAVIGIFGGEMFFGDEVDLGAVGGHADIFNFGRFVGGRIFGYLVGDGVVNAHVELHQAGAPGIRYLWCKVVRAGVL